MQITSVQETLKWIPTRHLHLPSLNNSICYKNKSEDNSMHYYTIPTGTHHDIIISTTCQQQCVFSICNYHDLHRDKCLKQSVADKGV